MVPQPTRATGPCVEGRPRGSHYRLPSVRVGMGIKRRIKRMKFGSDPTGGGTTQCSSVAVKTIILSRLFAWDSQDKEIEKC